MRLYEYLLEQRKAKHSSVDEFIKNTKIETSRSQLYLYETGKSLPSINDLCNIIKALNLNPKFVLTLWMHEQLPDETFRRYFPLPELAKEDQKNFKIISHNIDETITLSKGHTSYLIRNRLARQLLSYFYINPNDLVSLTELNEIFGKHDKNDIKDQLEKLIDFGYVGFSKGKYHALSKYFYVPSTPHYAHYRKQVMTDMLMYSDLDPQKTPYGNYREGTELYYKRTLTPEQLDYFVGLVQSLYNDLVQLPSSAGQEYNICLMVGAMNEK